MHFLRLLLAISCLGSASARATELHEYYHGVRALGMGDSSVATVNDETSLINNAAGLGRLRDFYGTILDPELELGGNDLSMSSAKSVSDPFNVSQVVPSAVASPNTYFHARAQLSPSLVFRNFGIGLLARQTMDATTAAGTTVNTYYQNDIDLLLGFNLRLWGGRIKIGFTGKVISRIEVNQPTLDSTQPLDTMSLAKAGLLTEGVGVGADVDMLLAAPWDLIPTLGARLHDIGGTSYNKLSGLRNSDAIARPNPTAQDLDIAVSIFPIHANRVRSSWTIEYRDLMTAANVSDKAKLLHAGLEFNFSDLFFLRGGYNQRYWTAGMEFATEHFQFQFASYGEEVGDEKTNIEDRRYVLKSALRF